MIHASPEGKSDFLADLFVICTLVNFGHGMYYLDGMLERKKYHSFLYDTTKLKTTA